MRRKSLMNWRVGNLLKRRKVEKNIQYDKKNRLQQKPPKYHIKIKEMPKMTNSPSTSKDKGCDKNMPIKSDNLLKKVDFTDIQYDKKNILQQKPP
eukprot:1170359-Heterocapsa_arctica.AAC.1